MNIVYLLGIVLAFVFVIFGITFDPAGPEGSWSVRSIWIH